MRRFVMVSYFGAGPDHGVPETDSFYPYAQAKAAADAHLRAGTLDWTVAKASLLALVPALAGMALGQAVRARISPAAFKLCFFAGLLALGTYLVVRALA